MSVVMSNTGFPLETIRNAITGDTFWEQYIQKVNYDGDCTVALHLAILSNPYFKLVLNGKKTLESRFSKDRRAPYQQVSKGDIILLKQSGKPIAGISLVEDASFIRLTAGSLGNIRDQFAEELYIEADSFWTEKATASFATILRLTHVKSTLPILFKKRDQRAWVVLCSRRSQLPLPSQEW